MVDFDHHTSARILDPDHVDATLLHTCPVSWTEAHGGFWYVTGYEDVDRVAKDHSSFSTREGIVIPPPPLDRRR
jgi:hypothetical protein